VSNVVIYTTVVSIENPHLELLPGMTANLRIETDAREGVSRVPNAALRWHPPGVTGADDHGQHVYVLNQGAPQAVPIARRHGRESHRDRPGLTEVIIGGAERAIKADKIDRFYQLP
jgi:hypothetical protein